MNIKLANGDTFEIESISELARPTSSTMDSQLIILIRADGNARLDDYKCFLSADNTKTITVSEGESSKTYTGYVNVHNIRISWRPVGESVEVSLLK